MKNVSFLLLFSFIHKMNTVEFKSATFPNAGSRHLLDDSVLESHSPTRGQAESSTLSSGISLGKCKACFCPHMKLCLDLQTSSSWLFFMFREQRGLWTQRGDVLASFWKVFSNFFVTSTCKKKAHMKKHLCHKCNHPAFKAGAKLSTMKTHPRPAQHCFPPRSQTCHASSVHCCLFQPAEKL